MAIVTVGDAINRPASAHTAGHVDDASNALRYIVHAYPDEPLFVIRGRDRLALHTLETYALLCHTITTVPDGMYEQVMKHRARFVEYAKANPGHMKWPDPYPGWNPV